MPLAISLSGGSGSCEDVPTVVEPRRRS